jgi:hypothetical protein
MKVTHSVLQNDGASVLWSAVEKCKGYSKVSRQLQRKLYKWFLKHLHVIQSPIANDIQLLKDLMIQMYKNRMGKLLLEIPPVPAMTLWQPDWMISAHKAQCTEAKNAGHANAVGGPMHLLQTEL